MATLSPSHPHPFLDIFHVSEKLLKTDTGPENFWIGLKKNGNNYMWSDGSTGIKIHHQLPHTGKTAVHETLTSGLTTQNN